MRIVAGVIVEIRGMVERAGIGTQKELAGLLNLSTAYASDVLHGRRKLNARLAVAFERLLGMPDGTARRWLLMQAEQEIDAQLFLEVQRLG